MDWAEGKLIQQQIECFDDAVTRHYQSVEKNDAANREAEEKGWAWSPMEPEPIQRLWADVLREGRALAISIEPKGVDCNVLWAFLGERGSARPCGRIIRVWLQSPEVEDVLSGDAAPTNPEPADDGPWSVALPKTAWARISTGSPNARPRSAEQFLEDSKAERTNPPRGRKWRVRLDKLSADQREAYENRQQ